MAKRKPLSQIVGSRKPDEPRADSGSTSRLLAESVAPDGSLECVCPDCGASTMRDGSYPPPFDVTCEQCLAIRAEVLRRIQQSIESIEDAEETGCYFSPVRPGWAKWRRVQGPGA